MTVHAPACPAFGNDEAIRCTCGASKRFAPIKDEQGDWVCEHGTAMDVHCCNCHNGFIFDIEHECPAVEEAALGAAVPPQDDLIADRNHAVARQAEMEVELAILRAEVAGAAVGARLKQNFEVTAHMTTTSSAHSAHCFCQHNTGGQRVCCGCGVILYNANWPTEPSSVPSSVPPPPTEDEPNESAERTLKSLATMLGWGNVPPRETLERDIAELKARAGIEFGALQQPTAADIAWAKDSIAKQQAVPPPERPTTEPMRCPKCGLGPTRWLLYCDGCHNDSSPAQAAALVGERPPEEEHECDQPQQCGAKQVPDGWSYECTRRRGHVGLHVAHGFDGKLLCSWLWKTDAEVSQAPVGTPPPRTQDDTDDAPRRV